MVLDMKKVNLQKSLDDGTLYVVEQIPTLVEYSDQTHILRKGNSCHRSGSSINGKRKKYLSETCHFGSW